MAGDYKIKSISNTKVLERISNNWWIYMLDYSVHCHRIRYEIYVR